MKLNRTLIKTSHGEFGAAITWIEIYRLFNDLSIEMIKCTDLNRELLLRCRDLINVRLETNSVESRSTAMNDDEMLFFRFTELIHRNYTISRKVDEYSTHLGVSSRKLTACCFKVSGKSAKSIIEERLIQESRLKLRLTSGAVKFIAVSMGFSDQYQFSKFFKKHTASSPKQYREKEQTRKTK